MDASFAVGDEMPEVITARFGDEPFTTDDELVDAAVTGLASGPLPTAYRTLADVLAAVNQPATEAEVQDEADAVAVFRSLRPSTNPPRRSRMSRRLVSARMLIAAGAVTFASATGAAAATGSLPGAAQDTAATMLAKLGITVPGANSHSGDHPDTRGQSGGTDSTTPSAPTSSSTSPTVTNMGKTISSLATDASTSGIDKAKAVSAVASDGHSNAGTNGSPSSSPTEPSTSAAASHSSSAPAGPPSSLPAGPPSSLPSHAAISTPAGPPSSLPAGPPSSIPGAPPSSVPSGPPSSHPGSAHS
jgi:hypothetical protein